mmetsp:Transcript_16306/g.35261  ORF Transcript_16306/g.35261 Transcript_16306/m.35261 type:complete len:109 (-) Transcript_16306:648-974(-)|eukprot:CAMPEP_0202900070 /NCGR_PEP_ID=MMETSP1392-20130828/9649_1 /ASSEMBLY_ACC=CAM_ASM_000868 /TAXON_ID=225041 /ORGANISM="Chlamydomonas chlamydogama, Strain SAG 11-48b" /LENGTH=108 /DNA_ID=CAMNT_0049586387 /DNA_START=61 /DNA_END=387 /DNA_ORIENTATION=+
MNFPLDSVGELPDEHKALLAATLEQMQVRDSLKMYNNLVERCFKECVEDFRGKALSNKEEQCVAKCCEKFMNVTGRVGIRFGEFFSEMEKQAQAQLAQMAAAAEKAGK